MQGPFQRTHQALKAHPSLWGALMEVRLATGLSFSRIVERACFDYVLATECPQPTESSWATDRTRPADMERLMLALRLASLRERLSLAGLVLKACCRYISRYAMAPDTLTHARSLSFAPQGAGKFGVDWWTDAPVPEFASSWDDATLVEYQRTVQVTHPRWLYHARVGWARLPTRDERMRGVGVREEPPPFLDPFGLTASRAL